MVALVFFLFLFFPFFFLRLHIVARSTSLVNRPDRGIHGSSTGQDVNFNKYPRYRGLMRMYNTVRA